MKLKIYFFLAAMLCISNIAFSQDNNSPQWNQPVSAIFTSGNYVQLPVESYIHPVTQPWRVSTPQGDFLVFPNIRFSIPKGEFVEITIFDITGREIAVVLSEPLEAGFYNVDFNAVNLASGIYFYKITAGDYSNVKKMVLIK